MFKQRGYNIVSNGTQNHLFLVDLVNKGLTGKAADAALGRANITVNKMRCRMILRAHSSLPVFVSVHLPSLVVGFQEEDVKALAGWMCDVLMLSAKIMKMKLSKRLNKSVGNLPSLKPG